MNEFAKFLREYIDKNKVRQKAIAQKTGYTESHICNIANGKVPPSYNCMMSILGAISYGIQFVKQVDKEQKNE